MAAMDADEHTPLRHPHDASMTHDAPSTATTSSRRFGASFVLRAIVTATLAACMFDGSGRAYKRYAYGVSAGDDAVALTKREYGDGARDKLRELRWTPTQGFFLVGGDGWFCKSWFGNSNFDTKARDAIRESVKRYFPSRIASDAKPFSVLFTTADLPWTPCANREYARARCHFDQWVPIISFGSTPRDASLLPAIRSGPLVTLLDCYTDRINEPPLVEGQAYNETPSCGFLNFFPDGLKYSAMDKCEANSNDPACSPYQRGLFTLDATDDASKYVWAELIPKVFWRGNDFTYLNEYYEDWRPASEVYLDKVSKSANASETMQTMIDNFGLGPRGRAVFLSKLNPRLIDAKFFDWGGFTNKGNRHALGEKLGVDAAVRTTEESIARFKYQLDLAGVGGTTWTGTISKLSMPGVLLHHESATMDSYFETLKPNVHYVAVDLDLRNLAEKVKWLEDNPESAMEIAQNAHKWVQWFRKVSVLIGYNHEKLVSPLREIIDPNDEHYLNNISST